MPTSAGRRPPGHDDRQWLSGEFVHHAKPAGLVCERSAIRDPSARRTATSSSAISPTRRFKVRDFSDAVGPVRRIRSPLPMERVPTSASSPDMLGDGTVVSFRRARSKGNPLRSAGRLAATSPTPEASCPRPRLRKRSDPRIAPRVPALASTLITTRIPISRTRLGRSHESDARDIGDDRGPQITANEALVLDAIALVITVDRVRTKAGDAVEQPRGERLPSFHRPSGMPTEHSDDASGDDRRDDEQCRRTPGCLANENDRANGGVDSSEDRRWSWPSFHPPPSVSLAAVFTG